MSLLFHFSLQFVTLIQVRLGTKRFLKPRNVVSLQDDGVSRDANR